MPFRFTSRYAKQLRCTTGYFDLKNRSQTKIPINTKLASANNSGHFVIRDQRLFTSVPHCVQHGPTFDGRVNPSSIDHLAMLKARRPENQDRGKPATLSQ